MNPTLLGALKSKTVWLNSLATLIEVANYVSPFIPPQYHAAVVAGIGVANVVLRSVTTQPLSEK